MISAVLVNWNGEAYLEPCLDALLAQEPAPDEVILVDNCSTDRSLEITARYRGVVVEALGENRGPGPARNAGVERATHELVLVLDNDAILEPGALAALVARMEAEPGAAMVQARSLCGDRPELVHYDAADLHFLGTLVLHNWFQPLAAATSPSGPVGAGVALCFLTRRQRFLEIGGFDPRMFFFYEDTQFSYRLRMRGYTIHLEPEARVVHLGGTAGLSMRGAADDYPARRTRLHARNRWYVLLTCMRWRTLFLTLPAQLLFGVVYAVFGARRGHFLSWCQGKWALFCMLPQILATRRSTQRGRVVPDRDLLVAAPLTFNPGLADAGFAARVRTGMDRLFGWYWRAVRRLCG